MSRVSYSPIWLSRSCKNICIYFGTCTWCYVIYCHTTKMTTWSTFQERAWRSWLRRDNDFTRWDDPFELTLLYRRSTCAELSRRWALEWNSTSPAAHWSFSLERVPHRVETLFLPTLWHLSSRATIMHSWLQAFRFTDLRSVRHNIHCLCTWTRKTEHDPVPWLYPSPWINKTQSHPHPRRVVFLSESIVYRWYRINLRSLRSSNSSLEMVDYRWMTIKMSWHVLYLELILLSISWFQSHSERGMQLQFVSG